MATTSNTGNPQKYVLMSQRPVVAQVKLFDYFIINYQVIIIFLIFLNYFCFQTPPNKTVYISQQNIKSEFQDPSN